MTRQGYGTSIPELLRRAVEVGTDQARMELGVAVMNKKAGQRYRGGSWYVATRAPSQDVRRFRLLGKEVGPDNVRRSWVDDLEDAHPYDNYRDALGACALQGEGLPMHEREAI